MKKILPKVYRVRIIKRLSIIAMLLCVPGGLALADEITLYNSEGATIAYIDTDDEMVIYLWNGRPVAYLKDGSVWGFNGKHRGWFEKGIIRDREGCVVGCIKNAVSMSYKFEPMKGMKGFIPLKGLRSMEPARPMNRERWGITPLSIFLASGAR